MIMVNNTVHCSMFARYCGGADYIVKIDDDVTPNLTLLQVNCKKTCVSNQGEKGAGTSLPKKYLENLEKNLTFVSRLKKK